ncbi:MAG: DUF305 domain-containing protein [Thermomicrobiales bacterium]
MPIAASKKEVSLAFLRRVRRGPGSSTGWILLAVMTAIAIGISVFAWQQIPHDPGENSADAGFLRDMQTHHAQAVEMAMIIRDRTSDEQLKSLATDIAFSQATERGMTTGYLDAWGLSFAGDQAPMTWMGHPLAAGEQMPGMATTEQIDQLRTLPVPQAEVLFLQLMIRHHQGGVEMAQGILAGGDNALVRDMANRTVRIQSSEIDTMNQFLVARGQKPITDPLPASHSHGA